MKDYIANMFIWDVYSYTNMDVGSSSFEDEYVHESDIVRHIREVSKSTVKKHAFYMPAFLLSPIWCVSRGMYVYAAISNAFMLGIFFLIKDYSWKLSLFLFAVLWLIFGAYSIFAYSNHIRRKLSKRHLLDRTPNYSVELDDSLRKEGKPSVLLAVLFVIIEIILFFIIPDVIFMVR